MLVLGLALAFMNGFLVHKLYCDQKAPEQVVEKPSPAPEPESLSYQYDDTPKELPPLPSFNLDLGKLFSGLSEAMEEQRKYDEMQRRLDGIQQSLDKMEQKP